MLSRSGVVSSPTREAGTWAAMGSSPQDLLAAVLLYAGLVTLGEKLPREPCSRRQPHRRRGERAQTWRTAPCRATASFRRVDRLMTQNGYLESSACAPASDHGTPVVVERLVLLVG